MQFNATGRHKRKKMSDSSRLLLSALCFISIGVSSHNLYRWPVLYLMWTWISFDTTHSSQMATILNDFEWKCESNLYSLLFEILVIKGRKSPTQSVRSQDALKQTMQIVLRRLRLLLLLEMGGLATTRATQRKKKTDETAQIDSMLQSTTFFWNLDFDSVFVDGFFSCQFESQYSFWCGKVSREKFQAIRFKIFAFICFVSTEKWSYSCFFRRVFQTVVRRPTKSFQTRTTMRMKNWLTANRIRRDLQVFRCLWLIANSATCWI